MTVDLFKIFKFAEDQSAGEQTIELIKAVVMYIYQTFKLKDEEVEQIIEDIPQEAAEALASTHDILIERGKGEGIEIGKEIGKAEGIQIGASISKQETEIRKDVELLLKLLQKFPNWNDQQMAEFTERPIEFVEKIRKHFNQQQNKTLKAFAKELFKDIPNIAENNLAEAEKWIVYLYNNFQKKK